jgi:carboxymethylenebutenolidase
VGRTVELTSPDGHRFGAFVSEPARAPRAGIVVGMEMYGVNGYLRSVCDAYAAHGYLAVAPCLFDRFETALTLPYDDAGSARGKDLSARIDYAHTVMDAETAADFLRAKAPGIKVAITGYCFGGTVAWLAACRGNFDAAVAWYGSNMCDYPDERPRCPVICHVGDADTAVPPADVAAFSAKRPEVLWHVYPGVPHGFDNQTRPARYVAAASKIARERTLAFLAETVG